MTIEEVINKVDWEGGLVEACEYGLDPNRIDAKESLKFRSNLLKAYKAWQDLKQFEDEYYTMCEECDY